MAITILAPVADDVDATYPESDFDDMSVDSDGGVELTPAKSSRPTKRPRLIEGVDIGTGIITPGEVVTNDPQWMRFVFLLSVDYSCMCVQTNVALIVQRTWNLYEPFIHVYYCHSCRNSPKDQQATFCSAASGSLHARNR